MSYTIEQAAVLAAQLERLATAGVHQIAGQFANLELWLTEAVHARACTRRTQGVAHDLGHRNEVGYLALRVVELAALSVGTSQLA